MSAKGRGDHTGGAEDFYSTPFWCVDRLLDFIGGPPDDVILDPCAGSGAIIRAVTRWCVDWDQYAPAWHVAELRAEEKSVLAQAGPILDVDCPRDSLHTPVGWDGVIITNPPYGLAQEFIETYALCSSRSYWLLRLNFLGSVRRAPMWHEFMLNGKMPNIYVLPNRPCFALTKEKKNGVLTGRMVPGTDACEYAWFEFGEAARGEVLVLDQTSDEDLEKAKQQLKDAYERQQLKEQGQMEMFNA